MLCAQCERHPSEFVARSCLTAVVIVVVVFLNQLFVFLSECCGHYSDCLEDISTEENTGGNRNGGEKKPTFCGAYLLKQASNFKRVTGVVCSM